MPSKECLPAAASCQPAHKPDATPWRVTHNFESLAVAQGVQAGGVRGAGGLRLPLLKHQDAVEQEVATKGYIAQHGIRDLLRSLTKEVVTSKPLDPVACMHQQLSLRLRSTARLRAAAQVGGGRGRLRESTDLLFLDDDALRACFEQHATGKNAASVSGMCKADLGAALATLQMPLSTEELDSLFEGMDLNCDGQIQVDEFLTAAKGSSHLEMLLQTLPIIRAFANVLASGNTQNPLAGYEDMSDFDVDESVVKCVPMLREIFKRNLQTLREARQLGMAATAAQSNGSDKFAFSIKGGTLKDFNDGITTRVGAPNPDLKAGMEIEHLTSADSHAEFTTGNYGIISTPSKEYNLAVSGGEGVDFNAGANKGWGATRVLRPLSFYGIFDIDGRLCERVDTTPDIIVKAGLTMLEIIAAIIYTGPMYWIWNTVLRGEEATPPSQIDVCHRCKVANNYYSSSLHALGSAIKKMQQSGHGLTENMYLYRGLSGGALPSRMFTPDENGHLGALPGLLLPTLALLHTCTHARIYACLHDQPAQRRSHTACVHTHMHAYTTKSTKTPMPKFSQTHTYTYIPI